MKRKVILAWFLIFGVAVICWSLDLSVTNAIEASLSSVFPDWSNSFKGSKIGNENSRIGDTVGYSYTNSESEVNFMLAVGEEVWAESDGITNVLLGVLLFTNYNPLVKDSTLGDGCWSVDSPFGTRFVAAWYSNVAVQVGSDNPQHAMAFVTNIIETVQAEKGTRVSNIILESSTARRRAGSGSRWASKHEANHSHLRSGRDVIGTGLSAGQLDA